jgi:hypothetical protein
MVIMHIFPFEHINVKKLKNPFDPILGFGLV